MAVSPRALAAAAYDLGRKGGRAQKREMRDIIPSIVASTHGDQMTLIAKISLDSFKLNTHAR